MANKPKVGLEYFPFEVTFFDDIKIRKLIKSQGGQALPIFISLLCTIYKNGYYMRWDTELPFVISEKTGYKEGFIGEVIKCCFEIDLLSKKMYDSNQILTSRGIQERYEKICWMLKRKTIVSEFSLIHSEDSLINYVELDKTSEELLQRKGKERKVKERKENVVSADGTSHPPWLNLIFEKNKNQIPRLLPREYSPIISEHDRILKKYQERIDHIALDPEKGLDQKKIDSDALLAEFQKKEDEFLLRKEKILRAEIEKFRKYYHPRQFKLKGGFLITEATCIDVFSKWIDQKNIFEAQKS